MFGARPSAVATLVDRATRYAMVVALPDGNKADAVAAVLIEHMGRLPTHLRRSLTWDRGSEMARHAVINHRAVDAGVLLRPAPPLAARHAREHEPAAAPIPAQERRPVHVHPGRARRHRRENLTTARVEYWTGPPQPRRSAQSSRNRCSWRPRSRCGSWLRSWLHRRRRTSELDSPAYNAGAPTRSPSTLAARSHRMRPHPKTSDHLRMPAALARGLRPRLEDSRSPACTSPGPPGCGRCTGVTGT